MDIIDSEIKRNNYSNYDDFFLTKIAANWPQIIINDFKEPSLKPPAPANKSRYVIALRLDVKSFFCDIIISI